MSQYPAGHYKHLDSEQARALADFKDLISTDGYYTPASENSSESHDDETLLRFLRARKFVSKDARQQFVDTVEWRKEQNIEQWYKTIDIDEYENTRLLYTHWTGRRDKRGIPLYVFKIGDLDAKKINEAESVGNRSALKETLSLKLRRLFATYEHLVNFVFPLCSTVESGRAYPETPISQTCNIVDISGVSFKQFWSLKSHLQEAGALASAHYPETLGRTYVVGAPSFFPTLWGYIKHAFDPITVAKVFILSSSEMESVLQEHVNVEDLPTEYGGSLEWRFGNQPDLDPAICDIMKMENPTTKTISKGPIQWQLSEDGTLMEAHAVGTFSGRARDEVIATIDYTVWEKGSG